MKKIITLLLVMLTGLCNYAGLTWTESFCDSLIFNASPKDNEVNLSMENCTAHMEIGKPIVPVRIVRFSVPYNATNIQLQSSVTIGHERKLTSPLHVIQDEYSDSVYTFTTGEFPQKVAEIQGVGYANGRHKIVTVAVFPTMINMNQQVVKTFTRVDIALSWQLKNDLSQEPVQPVLKSRAESSFGFDTSILVNPQDVENNSPSMAVAQSDTESYPYIIVAPLRLYKALSRLAAFRKLKGYECKIFSIESILQDSRFANGDELSKMTDDAGKLRAFLTYAYRYYDTKHVLLAGKYPEMPIRYIRYGERNCEYNTQAYTPSDYYFADLNMAWTKEDNNVVGDRSWRGEFMELNIGRIPFNSEQDVNDFVDKLKIYEHNPGLGNPEYLSKIFLTLQYKQFASNTYTRNGLIGAFDMFGDNAVKVFDEESIHPSGAEVIQKMNETPCGIHNFMGHGGPSGVAVSTEGYDYFNCILAYRGVFTYSRPETGNSIDCLTNKAYPGWSYSLSCTTMPFDSYKEYQCTRNFGESYILGKGYGGIAFLGHTRPSWSAYNVASTKYFFNTLKNAYENDILNESVTAGYLTNIIREYPGDDKWTLWQESFNLLGDPLSNLWLSVPKNIGYHETRSNDVLMYLDGIADNEEINVGTIDFGEEITTYQLKKRASDFNETTPQLNKLQVIYQKNSLPLVLPLKFQNYSFDLSDNYIVANDIQIGQFIDTSGTFDEGPVRFGEYSNLIFEAMGNLFIGQGTNFGDGSEVTFIVDGDATLSRIRVRDGAVLRVTANTITVDNIDVDEGAIVELTERNPATRIASRSEQEQQIATLEVGKTWWYNIREVAGMYWFVEEDYGMTVGEEVLIDGVSWHEINVTSAAWKDSEVNQWSYGTGKTFVCYAREENGKLYTMYDYDKSRVSNTLGIRGWMEYTGSFCMCHSFEPFMAFDTNLKLDDNFTKGWRNFQVSEESMVQNSGHEYRKVTYTEQDEYKNIYDYTIGIGAQNDYFFDPLSFYPCATEIHFSAPGLRYVTNAAGEVIYKGIGGRKLWEDLAGVEDVVVERNEVVEWFTLQGLRVAQPTTQGVYIRRQGSECRKVIVK